MPRWRSKSLMAMHWARSDAARAVHDRVVEEGLRRLKGAYDDEDTRLSRAYVEEFGRLPDPGEIEREVSAQVKAWADSNQFFVEKMAEYYNQALEKFRP